MAGSKQSGGKARLLKVVLLGDGGVGKSSLMNRFVSNKFDSQSFHTIGVEFLNKEVVVDNKAFTLQIWDTAGQERFKSLRTPFYRGADCCLLTFGVDDLMSFKNLAMWQAEFLRYADVQDGENFPFVVLGNKVDISEREVQSTEAQQWCDSVKMPYCETSAKDSINVDDAFHAAVQRVIELENSTDYHSKHLHTDTVDLSKKAQRGPCC